MRAYALLLGVLLTVGSAAVAELALESVRPPRGGRPWRRVTTAAASGPVWNGGVIDAITIDARGVAPGAAPISEVIRLEGPRQAAARLSQRHDQPGSE
jgi:hypothetical protein